MQEISGVENIEGSNLAETLKGAAEKESILGLAGNDTLEGRAGKDMLNGGTGADTMRGGTEKDTYFVDNAGDKVVELADSGLDQVRTTLDLYAPRQCRDADQGGNRPLHRQGRRLSNLLKGNLGDDRFVADAGGADTFSGGNGVDIMDFLTTGGVSIDLATGVHGGAAAGDVLPAWSASSVPTPGQTR